MNRNLSQGCEDCFYLSAFSPAKAKAPHGEERHKLAQFQKETERKYFTVLTKLSRTKVKILMYLLTVSSGSIFYLSFTYWRYLKSNKTSLCDSIPMPFSTSTGIPQLCRVFPKDLADLS